MIDPPWSKNQLTRLGKCIRDDTEVPSGLPAYSDVMSYFNDQAVEVQQKIENIDFTPLLRERPFEVTSRPKTIDTLQQKLRRNNTIQLPYVQDLAGVRFEADMTLDEQDAVANAIAGEFGHSTEACLQDLRDASHSGYRAVHLRLQAPSRVEVQVRTHLQGAWANMYEVAADVFGRDIRYGVLPTIPEARETVEFLLALSTQSIAPLEELMNEIGQEVATLEHGLRAINKVPKEHRAELLTKYRRSQASLDNTHEKMRSMALQVKKSLITLTDIFTRVREGKPYG